MGTGHRFVACRPIFRIFLRVLHCWCLVWLRHQNKIAEAHAGGLTGRRLREKLSRGIDQASRAAPGAEPTSIFIMPIVSTTEAPLEREVFWERHKMSVMVALVAAIVAVAGFGGYRFYSERRAISAANLLASAKTPADFQKVIADYPSTPAGGSAYLLLADAQKAQQKFAEANATLETFLQKFPKHELAGTARLAIGGNLEAEGKKDEALATYQKLATSEPQAFTAPVALFSQIHLLKEKKQIAEARRVCETIMTQYRESRFAAEAAYQLRLLKVAEPASALPSPSAPVPAPPAQTQSTAPSAAAPPVPKPSQPPAAPPKKP